jgi:hypothetical protein
LGKFVADITGWKCQSKTDELTMLQLKIITEKIISQRVYHPTLPKLGPIGINV